MFNAFAGNLSFGLCTYYLYNPIVSRFGPSTLRFSILRQRSRGNHSALLDHRNYCSRLWAISPASRSFVVHHVLPDRPNACVGLANRGYDSRTGSSEAQSLASKPFDLCLRAYSSGSLSVARLCHIRVFSVFLGLSRARSCPKCTNSKIY